jgi:glucose/arabinose dehydrogenase
MFFLLVFAAITNLSTVSASFAQLQERSVTDSTGGFVDTKFVTGLKMPTAMEFASDGRLFVAELDGTVRIIKDGKLLDAPFTTVPATSACCERGLLGITLDPNFASNGFVYVYYTANVNPIHNRVSRLTTDPANPDVALANSEKPILDLEPLAPNFHNGGPIHFGGDGRLYVGVGDNYNFENGQLLTN